MLAFPVMDNRAAHRTSLCTAAYAVPRLTTLEPDAPWRACPNEKENLESLVLTTEKGRTVAGYGDSVNFSYENCSFQTYTGCWRSSRDIGKGLMRITAETGL